MNRRGSPCPSASERRPTAAWCSPAPAASASRPATWLLARDFGGLAALAVHRLQTDRLRAEQQAHVESLLHAGRSITSSLVLQDVLDAVAREVVHTFGASYCVIWEYAQNEDALLERAGFGVEDGFTVDDGVLLLEERPREREILFSREPVLETLSDPALDAQSRASMEEWGEKTCLSLPLRFGEMTLGVLIICETERERRFTSEELDLAMGLANQALGRGAQCPRVPRPRSGATWSWRPGPGRSGC